MLDFPASPTNGQKFPQPAVSGVPVYTWDGEKWTTAGGEIVTATPATALPLMDAKTAVVGTTLKYAREDHVHPTDTTFFASEMAYSGMQINGGMEVSQERGTTPTSTSATFVCDNWGIAGAGTMAFTAYPALSPGYFLGFPNMISISINTAQVTLGASDFLFLYQNIEGFRIRRLMWGTSSAQPITIGFWTSHTRTGTYGGSIVSAGNARTLAFSYTQAVSNTPQYNTITIPGCTDGTWDIGSAVGLGIRLSMGCGTTYQAPATNTWYAANYIGPSGQVNGVAATSDNFRLTGLTVLPGTQAPTAAQSPNIMRPYDQELVTCMRYFESWSGTSSGFNVVAVGSAQSANVANVALSFKVRKRANPTLFSAGNFSFLYNGFGSAVTSGAVSILAPGLDSLLLQGAASGSSPFTVKEVIGFSTSDPNARLFFDARL